MRQSKAYFPTFVCTFIDPFVDRAADFETGRCVAEHGAFTDPDCRNRMFASSEREEAGCVTA